MNNDSSQYEGASDSQANTLRLSSWLQEVMKQEPAKKPGSISSEDDSALELLLDSNYHIQFYQQLPDFVLALLENNTQTLPQYAHLLYHLAGCSECHNSYLEIYDALREAVHPQGPRPQLGQGTKTLAATPPRMLSHLCRALINQAEALFQQGRRDHRDYDAPARSLLQQALSMSAHIGQSAVRRRALRDLVHVANLFEGVDDAQEDDSRTYQYKSVGSGTSGVRQGKKVLRHVEMPLRPTDPVAEQPVILIQARTLEGRITQSGETLFLELQGLAEALRGHAVKVVVPLGALIEPVRWRGGDPRAIRSVEPVDGTGKLRMPLGETELQLTNNEERNLLEAMFMLLEVRAID